VEEFEISTFSSELFHGELACRRLALEKGRYELKIL
jgi:hypothetical protein